MNLGIHVLRPTGIRLVPASPAQFSLSQNNIISSPPHFTSPTTTTVSCYVSFLSMYYNNV